MNKTLILDFFIFIICWLGHITFFTQLPALALLNIPLLYILLRIALAYEKNLWFLILFGGLLASIYAFQPWGLYLFFYPVACAFTYLTLYYLFTNRSLWSLTLGVFIGLVIFKFLEIISYYLTANIGLLALWSLAQKVIFTMGIEIIIVFILLLSLNFFTLRRYE